MRRRVWVRSGGMVVGGESRDIIIGIGIWWEESGRYSHGCWGEIKVVGDWEVTGLVTKG